MTDNNEQALVAADDAQKQLVEIERADAKVREMSALADRNPDLPALPKDHKFRMHERKDVELAFHSAFALLGGVPGLFAWATKNPDLFYSNYAKLLPPSSPGKEGGINAGQVNIYTGLPPSKLDEQGLPTLDAHMYEANAKFESAGDEDEE
jgi:hypothetical protein